MQETTSITNEPVLPQSNPCTCPNSATSPRRSARKRQTGHDDINKQKPTRKKRSAPGLRKAKKRSRSTEECEKALSNAKIYLQENPHSINLNCENILTLKSIRNNMEKDRQNFISQRVIALVAEDVVKDEFKRKLLKQYVSELNNVQENFPEEEINAVEGERLYQCLERVLDNIEIDSEDEN